MIVLQPTTADGHDVTMWLRPNRALSHGALRRLAWGLALVTLATAALGWRQGNVFAPLFALVEVAVAAWALGLAWHAGNRGERITLDRRSLDVEVMPGHRRTSFQSGWVRVLMSPAGNRQRLLLASHGRAVEIGAFLGDEERKELGRKLKLHLAQVRGPMQEQDNDGSEHDPQGCET